MRICRRGIVVFYPRVAKDVARSWARDGGCGGHMRRVHDNLYVVRVEVVVGEGFG